MPVKEKIKKKLKRTKEVMDETEAFLKQKTKAKLSEAKQKRVLLLGALKLLIVFAIAALFLPMFDVFEGPLGIFVLIVLVILLLYINRIPEK